MSRFVAFEQREKRRDVETRNWIEKRLLQLGAWSTAAAAYEFGSAVEVHMLSFSSRPALKKKTTPSSPRQLCLVGKVPRG